MCLSPALAWLWRLVAPRGHANPSIQTQKGKEMQSEGVGSYWAFATGRRVDQANLLLRQIVETPETRYVLIPNQHIGAWKVGFMAEWIAREYLARRGSARFDRDQVEECLPAARLYSQPGSRGRLNDPAGVSARGEQLQGGHDVYDEGARQWREFFARELKQFRFRNLIRSGGTLSRLAWTMRTRKTIAS